MPTPEARARRARRVEKIALLVAAIAMLGTAFAADEANKAGESAERLADIACADTEALFASTTARLDVNGEPQPLTDYRDRLLSSKARLLARQSDDSLDCEEHGIVNYEERLQAKLVEVEIALTKLKRNAPQIVAAAPGAPTPGGAPIRSVVVPAPSGGSTGSSSPSGNGGTHQPSGGQAPATPAPAPTPAPSPTPQPTRTCRVVDLLGVVCL